MEAARQGVQMMRYLFKYYDLIEDSRVLTRCVVYFKAGHTYVYIFEPETAHLCMETVFAHGMDDNLNLTIDEAGAIVTPMEDLIDENDYRRL
jgi:uncharacterized protein YuzE